jgi:hypothetical protein
MPIVHTCLPAFLFCLLRQSVHTTAGKRLVLAGSGLHHQQLVNLAALTVLPASFQTLLQASA